MKILYVIDSLRSGGKERRLVELLKGMRKETRDELHLVLMSREVAYSDVFDLDIPISYFIRSSRKDPTVAVKLYSLCRRMRPDLIHVWDGMTALYSIPASLLQGIPLVNSMITDAPVLRPFSKRWLRSRLAFPFSRIVLGNSQAGLRAYEAPRDCSRCIYNGFDPGRLSRLKTPDQMRSELGIVTPNVIVMVGSFLPFKDYASYRAVALRLVEERPDVTFLAVGDGPQLEEFRATIPAEYRDRIRLLGRRNDVESIINIATVGVLLTDNRFHGEGISNAIMEYMAQGKPVVATDGGGTPEIVLDQETGFLVPQADVDRTLDALRALMNDPQLAFRMGECGRNRVATVFSLTRMVDEFRSIYEEIVGHR